MNHFESLEDFAEKKLDWLKEQNQLLEKYFQKESFKKNEIVLHAGEICHKLYFIHQGILRTFHINSNGSEFTRLIVKENEFCTILVSFSEKIASPANIQALENTETYSITFGNFQKLMAESEQAKSIYTKILEDFQNFQIKRIEFLTSFSPQEKVEIFLAENPELEPRLTDKVIASYLQITPETYSRCKKNAKS